MQHTRETLEAMTKRDTVDALRGMAMWLENAADCWEDAESEYDLDSDYAVAMRTKTIECLAEVWLRVTHSNPEVRWRMGRGLDMAQRICLGHDHQCPLHPPEPEEQ